jgi:hypothetical protein
MKEKIRLLLIRWGWKRCDHRNYSQFDDKQAKFVRTTCHDCGWYDAGYYEDGLA